MNRIESGVVRAQTSGVWEIDVAKQSVPVKYNQAAFPDILEGSEVYFVRNPADTKVAINVQPKMLVDEKVKAAAPTNGYTSKAQARLRSYIMDQLLAATRLAIGPRKVLLQKLDGTMSKIKSAADISRSKKITLKLLTSLGIP